MTTIICEGCEFSEAFDDRDMVKLLEDKRAIREKLQEELSAIDRLIEDLDPAGKAGWNTGGPGVDADGQRRGNCPDCMIYIYEQSCDCDDETCQWCESAARVAEERRSHEATMR
jgi:hypothetical protein